MHYNETDCEPLLGNDRGSEATKVSLNKHHKLSYIVYDIRYDISPCLLKHDIVIIYRALKYIYTDCYHLERNVRNILYMGICVNSSIRSLAVRLPKNEERMA